MIIATTATPNFLGDVVRFANGKSIKPGGDGCYPVYGSNGIIGGSDDFRYENGMIIGRVGAYCGSVAYCPDKFLASDNTLVAFPASEHFDTKFLFYLLTDANLSRYAGGAAQPLMTQTVLKQVKVKVPPLPVQCRIAGILSAYDDLIEYNLRRIRILEKMARSLYREWFVKFRFPGHEKVSRVESPLGSIPEGWDVKLIVDLCESVSYGFTASATREEIGPKFLRITDIVPDIIEWGEVPFCEISSDKSRKYLLQPGDIVVARTGATTGFAKRINKRHPLSVFASYLVRVRAKGNVSNRMLGILMESDEYKQFIKVNIGGAAQPQANAVVLTSMRVIVPPPKLAGEFDRLVEPFLDEIELLAVTNRNLRRTRDLLLPRLLSGTVNVSDADSADCLGSDVGKSVEPVATTQRRSDTVAISIKESPLSEAATQEHPGNQLELGYTLPTPIDQTDRSNVLAAIRQVFSDGQPRTRQYAIREVAQALGYGRVGHRINDVLQTDLLTAVRRGILDNVEDELILLARSIADYDRDLLKRQFLAAVGRSWIERDQAVQNFCRWMGYRRTGPIIDETALSLIQGLLRESRLEADGAGLIRRCS